MDINTQYMRLIDSICDYAIFLLDPNGCVVHWSSSAKRLNGYEDNEILSKHFRIFYTKEDQSNYKPELEVDAVKKLGRVEDESWRVKKDGTKYWANVVITAIRDEIGTLQGMGKIVRDLTEKRNSQLSIEAAQVRTQFLTNMSHEIRTPMNCVVSVGQLLKQTSPLSDHQSELVEILNDSSDMLIKVINDILDFEKLDKTEIQLSHDIFDPIYEIHKIVRKYEIRHEKEILFYVHHDAQIQDQNIIADLYRFRQIMSNLIDNAYKFTPKGSISVTIKYIQSSILNKLYIEVQDTGIGVDKAHFPKLFQLFSQVDAGNKKKFQGTGLGLAICKILVETMGGEINVESNNVGAKFFFTIGYQACDKSFSPPSQKLTLSANIQNSSISKKFIKNNSILAPPPSLLATNQTLKILIAEDNLLNQKVLVHILHKLGYSLIEIVINGEQAVSKALNYVYDVILMDVQMPIMDGIEATQKIKQIKPSYIIIAMTAGVSETDKIICLQSGMDFYLSKPVSIKDLYNLVKTLPVQEVVAVKFPNNL